MSALRSLTRLDCMGVVVCRHVDAAGVSALVRDSSDAACSPRLLRGCGSVRLNAEPHGIW